MNTIKLKNGSVIKGLSSSNTARGHRSSIVGHVCMYCGGYRELKYCDWIGNDYNLFICKWCFDSLEE